MNLVHRLPADVCWFPIMVDVDCSAEMTSFFKCGSGEWEIGIDWMGMKLLWSLILNSSHFTVLHRITKAIYRISLVTKEGIFQLSIYHSFVNLRLEKNTCVGTLSFKSWCKVWWEIRNQRMHEIFIYMNGFKFMVNVYFIHGVYGYGFQYTFRHPCVNQCFSSIVRGEM